MVERGWLDPSDPEKLTPLGATARQQIEETTDRLAAEPWERMGEEATAELRALLKPMAARIADLGVVPVPNPIGLRTETEMTPGRD
jgi:hypothetical protein